MGSIFLRIRTWWETADRTQKVVSIFGSAFLLLLLSATYIFASKPKMGVLYSGLTATEAGRVIQELQKLQIDAELDPAGTVTVPSDKVAEARATLARTGTAPAGAHMDNAALGDMNLMTSQSVEKAKLVAIREGEIAKTIEGIGGIQSARVLINPGTQSGFAGEDEPPTASVMVVPQAGAQLGPDQAKAIAALVAKGGFPGLTDKNVTVVDNAGSTLYDTADEARGFGQFATKADAQASEAKRVKRELQPLLDRAFGAGNTMVAVRVEMDFDTTSVVSDTPTVSKDPVAKTTYEEKMTPGAGGSAPPAGLSTGGGGATSGNGNYTGSQEVTQHSEGKTHQVTEKAKGTVTSMSLTVLADSGKKVDPVKVEEFLKAYLGPKTGVSDPNFTVKATAVEFDRTGEAAAKKAAESAASADKMQQYFSLLPVLALVIVALLVLKSLAKVAKSSGNVLVQALPGGGAGGAQLALAGGGATHALGAGGGSAQSQLESQLRGHEPAHNEPVEVGEISERLNVPLEQIKKMAAEKPHTVSMLLKGWLLEDKR